MMNYTEIVKQLREYPLVQIAQEAADAIEALVQDNARISEAYDAASRDLMRRTVQLEELRERRGAKIERQK